MKTQLERFMEKVKKLDSCWIWMGSNNGVGYGEIRINNKKVYAHRWSVENLSDRKIPDGMQIDHLCRNPSCVNPDHLEIVTSAMNVRRGLVAGKHPERMKEYCSNGHLYSKYEYQRPDGKGRNCAECVRNRAREYARRKNGYYDRHK